MGSACFEMSYALPGGTVTGKPPQYVDAKTPDVIVPLLARFHWEIKFRERGNPRQALEQAVSDACREQIPIVGFKKSYADWIVCLSLENFFEICRQLPAEWLRGKE